MVPTSLFGAMMGYTPLYYLRSGGASSRSTAYSEKHDGTVWQLENVLMYDKTIDKHTFSVLLGQSAKKNTGSYLRGTRNNIINYSRPYNQCKYRTGGGW